MKKSFCIILTFISIFIFHNIHAQEVILKGDSTSMVNLRGDIRLGSAQQIPGGKPQKTFNIEGYRIVIYRGESKSEAQNTKSKFSKKFAKVQSLILFDSPIYYVRIGNFKTENEAQIFLDQIKSSYPNAVIIEDLINVTL